MKPSVVVLDFDGTFTDVDREAAPFLPVFRRAVADLLGQPLARVEEAWARHEAALHQAPDDYGWVIDGRIVAPATVDPYLLATNIATRLQEEAGVLRDGALRSEVNQVLYRLSYQASGHALKPEAREVLETLLARVPTVCFITNADPHVVAEKLDSLKFAGRELVKVFGNARKFLLAPDGVALEGAAELPEAQSIPGLARPVYLRRPHYHQVLRQVVEAAGARWEQLLVCGDIFELDLALPAVLGAQVHLVLREGHTLPFERRAISQLGGRGSMGGLRDVLARL